MPHFIPNTELTVRGVLDEMYLKLKQWMSNIEYICNAINTMRISLVNVKRMFIDKCKVLNYLN